MNSTGLIVEQDNDPMLAGQLADLAGNTKFARRLGEAGRAMPCASTSTKEVVMAQLSALYDDLSESPDGARGRVNGTQERIAHVPHSRFAGIEGVGEPLARARLERMCGAIYHRGPDSAGYFVAPGVAMGSGQDSAYGQSVVGGSPFPINDRTITVVFNGDIYRPPEIRTRLERSGSSILNSSDTKSSCISMKTTERTWWASSMEVAFSIRDATKEQELLIARRS